LFVFVIPPLLEIVLGFYYFFHYPGTIRQRMSNHAKALVENGQIIKISGFWQIKKSVKLVLTVTNVKVALALHRI